ncbi:hypothetical protein B0I35DRAFT_485630 [Stachybotrys elegans]|uniref:Uncharacterized protein n=1 Tax=Stachybotrys elegans TaxID=80388 RepID=A0A8K0SER2_9HYPO|nr:hypothetical protein B0I35DRAFT_485630 [Stachybotrys elegans]
MPSYLITGVSRGLGFEFLRQLSANADNIIIGIVRDKATTDKKIADELSSPSNVTILQADVGNYEALKATVSTVAEVTGGSLDYLIANAAYVPDWDSYDPIGVLAQKPQELEEEILKLTKINVVSVIHLISLYMPLILKGTAKKVIGITSGHADAEAVRQFDLGVSAGYAISKASLNMVMAKFSAQYREQGVLFLALSPGVVEVGHHKDANQQQQAALWDLAKKFMAFAPDFRGPSTPDVACKAVVNVWESCSIEKGNGGAFLSHHGDKNWL